MLGFRMMKKRMFERVRKVPASSTISLSASEDSLAVARTLVNSELSNLSRSGRGRGVSYPGRGEILRIKRAIVDLIGRIEGQLTITPSNIASVKHIIKDGTMAIHQEARRIALSGNGKIDEEQLKSLSEIITSVKKLKAFYLRFGNRRVRKG